MKVIVNLWVGRTVLRACLLAFMFTIFQHTQAFIQHYNFIVSRFHLLFSPYLVARHFVLSILFNLCILYYDNNPAGSHKWGLGRIVYTQTFSLSWKGKKTMFPILSRLNLCILYYNLKRDLPILRWANFYILYMLRFCIGTESFYLCAHIHTN